MNEEEIKKVESKAKKEVVVGSVVEVPTQYGLAFQLEDGSVVDSNELLVRIYNDLQKLKRGLL